MQTKGTMQFWLVMTVGLIWLISFQAFATGQLAALMHMGLLALAIRLTACLAGWTNLTLAGRRCMQGAHRNHKDSVHIYMGKSSTVQSPPRENRYDQNSCALGLISAEVQWSSQLHAELNKVAASSSCGQ